MPSAKKMDKLLNAMDYFTWNK